MLNKRVVIGLICLCCLIVALAPVAAFAQSASTGTVTGVVKDSTGAAVAGATVTLTDTTTKDTRTTAANDVGTYFFANVSPGTYNVAIKKAGFRVAQFSNQVVTVGSALTLNATMEVGSATQVIEVTTTGAELQTMNSTVGNTVDRNALDKLPTIGRDSNSFLTLQPGVGIDGSVAGTVVDQSTFLLDGGQNTNDMDGSMNVYTTSLAGSPTGVVGGGPTGVMPTPIDSVEEFKVNTVNQTADFNSSAGAQVQIVTRKGTNAWHGSGYEYYLDNAWNANGWNNNNSGQTSPSKYHYNRFGGSIGGPIISKKVLGGKTYFFANYEGFRWPGSTVFTRTVPTASMKAGILKFVDPVSGVIDSFNMATGTNCGPTASTVCDPRGLGLNPEVSQIWNKFEPLPNTGTQKDSFGNTLLNCSGGFGSTCDGLNEATFKGQLILATNSDFGVARIDHDFSDKWHFYMSYRDYKFTNATTCQVDIGGFFPGDTLGTPASNCGRPIQPWFIVGALTTNISPNVTNDLHYSYLRNWWSWQTNNGPPQLAGLGGALEIFGESGNALIPYNVNTQSIRTRFWDGQDQYLRDDVTILHGKHLFTFGATYEYNWDWHQRSDNGGGINFTPTYQIGDSVGGGLVDFTSTQPGIVSSNSRWARDSAAVLGIVTDSQVAFTRSGPTLVLNPPLTHAEDKSTIPYYNFYFSDSFHLVPTFTLTYGLGWTLEMPPTEALGRQIELVDSSSQQLDVQSYLNTRKAQALLGQVYNPEVGFALVGNTGGGQKYPYDPFYGSFSPRVAGAWSPNFDSGILGKAFGSNKTVFRAGYSRIYGRLNGVDLVLVPLLGTGLIQPVQCRQNYMNGTCGGSGAPPLTVANAFRIGTDGLSAPLQTPQASLPQPTFPGFNSGAGSAGSALDPHFRPNVVDSFDFTIQRQIGSKILVEVGYIGRLINHEFQPININAVPYMMTLGGQTFASAYAAVEKTMGCTTSYTLCNAATKAGTVAAVTPQPFFEAALAGTGYCNGFTSCTAAVASHEFGNFNQQAVWNIWSDLDKGEIGGGPICNTAGGCLNANGSTSPFGTATTTPGFEFMRSMLNSPINTSPFGASGQLTSGVGVNASVGFGNYHAAFATVKFSNWRGLSSQSTFTFSKALGTGAFVQATSEYTPNDSFNIGEMYGVQGFDRQFVFNSIWIYDIPFYKSQKGLIGHILGGWSLAPIITVGSGGPDYCGTNTNAQTYGSGDGANFFDNEQCHVTGNVIPNGEPVYIVPPGSATNPYPTGPASTFQTAAQQTASYNLVRPGILGLDTKDAGVGIFYGHGYWNIDAKLSRNIKVTERVSANFEVIFTNIFNHVVFQDPNLDVTSPSSWGSVGGQANNPRAMQLGARISF